MKLDLIDRRILEILQKNAKITNAQLSKEIGLSPAPTLERVKKLENQGLIKSYHAKLDQEKLGIGITTFILVNVSKHSNNQLTSFMQAVQEIDEVVECHHITGSGDFLLKVLARDISAYQEFLLKKLSNLEEIANMQTLVVMSTSKDSKSIPLS